jgi:hypothetical protein
MQPTLAISPQILDGWCGGALLGSGGPGPNAIGFDSVCRRLRNHVRNAAQTSPHQTLVLVICQCAFNVRCSSANQVCISGLALPLQGRSGNADMLLDEKTSGG